MRSLDLCISTAPFHFMRSKTENPRLPLDESALVEAVTVRIPALAGGIYG